MKLEKKVGVDDKAIRGVLVYLPHREVSVHMYILRTTLGIFVLYAGMPVQQARLLSINDCLF